MKYADEIQLVEESQSGSRAAFAELVCRYREEVAKFLDVPQGTVKRRLFDARQKLKRQLSETFDEQF